MQVSIGSSGSALRDAFTGGGSGITYSITTDPDADQVALREEVQAAVADLDDAGTFTVAGGGGGFGSSDIEIDVTAPDSATLQEATDAVVAAVDGGEGIGQVSSNLAASLPFIAVTVDRDQAASLGLSEVAVGALVSNTMQPQRIGTVEIDDTALTVYLAASQTPATLDELRALTVPSAAGPIPLEEVATVEETRRPDLDHDRGRAAHRDRHGHAVHRRPHDRVRLGEHGAGRGRPARLGGRRARRRRSRSSRMPSPSSAWPCSRRS